MTFKGVKSFKTYAQELEQLPRRKLKASCDVLRIAVLRRGKKQDISESCFCVSKKNSNWYYSEYLNSIFFQ